MQSQLAGASADIGQLLARAEPAAARLRLERLQAGCITLGLSGAAVALKPCAEGALSADLVHAALADALNAVMYQSELVKRLLGPS